MADFCRVQIAVHGVDAIFLTIGDTTVILNSIELHTLTCECVRASLAIFGSS